MIVFGPVPSRRLGRSLGINNTPPKVCTYSCIYCQLGRAKKILFERHGFYPPEEVLKAARDKIVRVMKGNESIDYITFVADGEPTLDVNLGREIDLLRSLRIKIGVITNASLIWRENVRKALMKADLVSIKIDALEEEIWKKINRPHGKLRLKQILEGIQNFAKIYKGELITETMLVKGINDRGEHIKALARFLSRLNLSRAYLSIPTRPPAEKWVEPPDEETINRSYQVFNGRINQVELLIGYEGNDFTLTGAVEEDLLSTTAVHPMRRDAVDAFLRKSGVGWPVIQDMVRQGRLVEMDYKGKKFYMRKLDKNKT